MSSVVLGSGVVLYGSSLFQSNTQTEGISVTETKVWVHTIAPDGLAWGASAIRNTGDKVVAIDKIQIRGAEIPFTQWYPDTDVSPNVFQQALNHTGWSGVAGQLEDLNPTQCTGGPFTINIDPDTSGPIVECIQANAGNGPVSLNPGQAIIIYYKLTNSTITSLDSGGTTTINVIAGKAGGPQNIPIIGKS